MRVNEKTLLELEKELEFEAANNKKYEVKAIINNVMYNKQANNEISGFYYLIL